MKAYFTSKPDALLYMPLPDSTKADAWLRKNIQETTDEEGNHMWEADEVYIRTTMTRQQVEDHFDEIFDHGGEVVESGDPGGNPGASVPGVVPDGEISAEDALNIIMGVMA